MQVKDVMTKDVEYISRETNLKDAAELMRELDCGFLPIGNKEEDKLAGVVTDRDITIRAVAQGLNPNSTTVDEIKTDKVLYCFENDDIDKAAKSMREQQVYRLIVLNNKEEKRLRGVVTLGDIVRSGETKVAEKAAEGISAKHAA